MDKFIKNGEKIFIRPSGIDIEIKNSGIYKLKYDEYQDIAYLEEDDSYTLPDTIYENEGDSKFINKCITTFKNTCRNTTGILLSGLKGSGKTLMSKRIALASGVPIIIVDNNFPSVQVERFFCKLKQDYCVIFDEAEKNWMTYKLLGFLDGLKTICNKLVIFTCNDINKLDSNLLDRCSRIRYHHIFDTLNENVVENVVNKELKDKSKTKEVTKYILNNFSTISFDNVILFTEEVNNCTDETLEEIMYDLNLTRNNASNGCVQEEDDDECFDL